MVFVGEDRGPRYDSGCDEVGVFGSFAMDFVAGSHGSAPHGNRSWSFWTVVFPSWSLGTRWKDIFVATRGIAPGPIISAMPHASRAHLAHKLTSRQGKPEPQAAAVPAARDEPGAKRGAAVPGVVVPAPAPEHPARARRRTCRIGNQPRRIVPIPVLAPLPHIPVHVVQAPGIRLASRLQDVYGTRYPIFFGRTCPQSFNSFQIATASILLFPELFPYQPIASNSPA